MGSVAVTRRVIERQFTIAANTAEASPYSETLDIVDTQLIEVQVIIPRGHNGLTGLAVVLGTTRVLPWDDPTAWLRGNDEDRTFPIYTQAPAVATIIGFNTGQLEHSFYLRFLVDDNDFMTTTRTGALSPL